MSDMKQVLGHLQQMQASGVSPSVSLALLTKSAGAPIDAVLIHVIAPDGDCCSFKVTDADLMTAYNPNASADRPGPETASQG